MKDIRGALIYGQIYEAEAFKYLNRFKITGKCEENLKEKVKVTLNKCILKVTLGVANDRSTRMCLDTVGPASTAAKYTTLPAAGQKG